MKQFFSLRTGREKRMAVYLVFLASGWGGLQAYQHWTPDFVHSTDHYEIASTETPERTQAIAEKAEETYRTYTSVMGERLPLTEPTEPLQLRLYKNEEEFRRANVMAPAYAKALYARGRCHQFYDDKGANPWHWMIHEATHQLNHQVANLDLKLWLEEGMACYFSTSFIRDGLIEPGKPDFNAYPIWWLTDVKLSGDWETDVEEEKIIPLENLIRDNGPNRNKHFNTYYLHWWSWAHFLFHADDGRYRDGLFSLLAEGGSLKGFEEHVGSIDEVEKEWYAYYQFWVNAVDPSAPKL